MNLHQRKYGNLCSDNFRYKNGPSIEYNLEQVSFVRRLAHRLRLAVFEGGSDDPDENAVLKEAIRAAIRKGMKATKISKVIENLNKSLNPSRTHIVQLRLGLKVCAIITANCSSMQKLTSILQPLLKRHKATFDNVLPFFNYENNIEAITYDKIERNSDDLAKKLINDGLACNAYAVRVVDYETGAVSFKSNTVQLSSTCESLKNIGYQILHLYCSFAAKAQVRLNDRENERYFKFLTKLLEIPEVLKVTDNVALN
ncbi:uncharacterized protein LOC119688747 [Teleopsis dalmanni]|uniref:uncharacterized protein LOC119682284 n=1 Tax=Teleopsis dalmanni TaxID=139649 RepID=UPI0018CF593C|nr:uncharacterized protein LOC119682284 [Teleopsis dalmanni]XP_037951631.1 uncharacterized protein LOC119682292 [Teleopsis dalmanni]XP_037959367.1 uncharacterized protein LOC119688747 [Teleopsis dalmanni]